MSFTVGGRGLFNVPGSEPPLLLSGQPLMIYPGSTAPSPGFSNLDDIGLLEYTQQSLRVDGNFSANQLSASNVTTEELTANNTASISQLSVNLSTVNATSCNLASGYADVTDLLARTATASNVISSNVRVTDGVIFAGNQIKNQVLCLFRSSGSEFDGANTAFYGYGIAPNLLRSQIPTSAASFGFFAGGTEIARLTGTGRLGIGNNPAFPLDVTGAGRFTGSLTANGVLRTSSNLIVAGAMSTRDGAVQIVDGSDGKIFAAHIKPAVASKEYADDINGLAIAAQATAAAALAAVTGLAFKDKLRDFFKGPPTGYDALNDLLDAAGQFDDTDDPQVDNILDYYTICRRPFVTNSGLRQVGFMGNTLHQNDTKIETFHPGELVKTQWGCNVKFISPTTAASRTVIDFGSNESYLNVRTCNGIFTSNVSVAGNLTVAGTLNVAGEIRVNNGAVILKPNNQLWLNNAMVIDETGRYLNNIFDNQVLTTSYPVEIDDLLCGEIACRTVTFSPMIDNLPYTPRDVDSFSALANRFDPGGIVNNTAYEPVFF